MTADRPTGAELLEIAARVLRREILPKVAADKRLETLMVLRAMTIAGGEIADAGAAAAATAAGIAALYGDPGETMDEADTALPARLAADIRAGAFDAAERAEALHAVLLDDATRRLRLANPKYLDNLE